MPMMGLGICRLSIRGRSPHPALPRKAGGKGRKADLLFCQNRRTRFADHWLKINSLVLMSAQRMFS